VAGDFYWLEKVGTKTLIAAADCTGHGVPGAMVSVVCNNALNKSVREHQLSKPGDILTKTRELVLSEFREGMQTAEKVEEEVKDGMDIALCSFDKVGPITKLEYAGANNPLWIIRKDSGVIEEIKAHKQPIGKYTNPTAFPNHEIILNAGDSIYIFSDGYADQFGGEKGKKLKAANFKKLLLEIQPQTMEEQKKKIEAHFTAWKGKHEQLDDVCVIGVRID
jgi:serine phosphatase RsbU (regulator of sigma subunit)